MIRHILALTNPHSGKGLGLTALQQLEAAADQRGVEVTSVKTQRPGHAKEWIQTCSLEDIDALVVIGGDGTVHEVVNGLMARKEGSYPPLGILPAGTGDALMTDLGSPSLNEAIQRIFSGTTRSIDLFQLESGDTIHYGFNMIGCGLPSRINHHAENARLYKKLRYHAGIVKALWSYTSEKGLCRLPETHDTITSDFIIATNTRHVGNGLQISPQAELDDGRLNLLVLKPLSRWGLLKLFLKLNRGTHLDDPAVTTYTVSTFTLHLPPGSEINIDGEQHPISQATITVLPKKLTLLV